MDKIPSLHKERRAVSYNRRYCRTTVADTPMPGKSMLPLCKSIQPYYQKESVGLDIYGFGRTVQYLLSESDVEPYLTRKEESKLKKIISRCLDRNSKKSFQNVSEIQKIIPKNIQSKKDKQIQAEPTIRFAITVLGLCMIAGLAAGGGYMAVHSICSVSEEQKSEKQKKNQEGGQAGNRTEGKVMAAEDRENQEMKKESQLSMELGLVHFLKFKDYKKSREYFKEAGEYALAEHMEVIAETLSGEAKGCAVRGRGGDSKSEWGKNRRKAGLLSMHDKGVYLFRGRKGSERGFETGKRMYQGNRRG